MKRKHLSSAIGLVLGLAMMAPLQAQQAPGDASSTTPTAARQAEATAAAGSDGHRAPS